MFLINRIQIEIRETIETRKLPPIQCDPRSEALAHEFIPAQLPHLNCFTGQRTSFLVKIICERGSVRSRGRSLGRELPEIHGSLIARDLDHQSVESGGQHTRPNGRIYLVVQKESVLESD